MSLNHHIDAMNDLLRGELSAAETYVLALSKLGEKVVAPTLAQIRNEHIDAAERLSLHIRELGGSPSSAAGAWGQFARSVESVARLFGENSALAALLQGEELGQIAYEQTLDRDSLESDAAALIRETLLPRQRRHVSTLRGMTRGL